MFQISRTTPAFFITSVTHDRLPIFQTDRVKHIVCNALDEARTSGRFMIFAYVIMANHLHLITDSARVSKHVLRFVNGIAAKRILDYLKDNGHESSLAKLRVQERQRKHKHSVFQHHSNVFEIYGEDTMMQKVNYVHLNPVNDGYVVHPDEYHYSSSRQWHQRALDEEPLVTDHKNIHWR
ncbi:MAG: hypothetical protein WBD16_08520 [Pyrinomonadaceae bacterium]